MATSEFERGRVEERLASHDKHFALINGSLKEVAENLGNLNLGIQRLIDSAAADRATVLTTAKALKDADDARRDKGDAKWSPVQRLIGVLGALGAITGVVVAVLHH